MGELSKWVPVSKQRILGVSDAPAGGTGISVQVAGAPGEEVVLTFLDRANELHTAMCAFEQKPGQPSGGNDRKWVHATAACSSTGCSCV